VEDRIFLCHFSQLANATRFAIKTVSAPRLADLGLVLLICGYLWLFGCCSSPVLAQPILALLPGGLVVPAVVFAAAVVVQETSGEASYSRFSCSNQTDRTIADQQRDCHNRAARDGLVISKQLEFSDEAISGAKHSRAGFDAMLEAARAGRFRVLYVANLSRLARDLQLTITTLNELKYRHGVRVVSIDDNVDTDVENWELLAAVNGSQNQQQLRTLAKNVFRGQEGVVIAGLCVGDLCFGYASEPVEGADNQRSGKNRRPKMKYVVDPAKAEWVRRIFHWFVRERKPLRWIVRELNRLGAPKDHRATTSQWRHQLLTKLLSNRKYVGIWSWGERKNIRNPLGGIIRTEKRPFAETEEWTRHFPDLQIIDDETFSEAQKLLKANAESHKNQRAVNGRLIGSSRASHNAHPRHLLSGLIECGHCGRPFRVSGPNGKYMVCSGHGMGVCSCQTQLRRDLAETLVLDAICQRILLNPNWVELLLDNTRRSFERQSRELPTQRRAIESALADVNERIAMLIANSEKQLIPELEARMAELRAQREGLQVDLKKVVAEDGQPGGPPTKEWIEEQLGDLRSRLTGQGAAAAHALRALVGGKIIVTEVRRPGKKRHYLRCRMELRLHAVADAAGARIDEPDPDHNPTETIEFDLREPERCELLADEAKQLWDTPLTEKEVALKLDCSRTLVTHALDHWYAVRGLQRPDGRSLRKRLKRDLKADKLREPIMQLWHKDEAVTDIAKQLQCCMEVVREVVVEWHQQEGLPVPDGRTRRREIRLRRREAAKQT
jgi:DNA invertase Pin-like site-specific DNA recombinase